MAQLYTKRVPNRGKSGAPILLVGESPGGEEEFKGLPFVGPSGEILETCLMRGGLTRNQVYMANLCQYRPHGNIFTNCLGSQELENGQKEIHDYIRRYRPNVVAALGGYPLKFLTGKLGISHYRGSILPCTLAGCEGVKVIAANHPSYILRNRNEYPIFAADLHRIISDSAFPELRYRERNYYIDPQGLELEEWVWKLSESDRLGCDIESVKKTGDILCISFAPNPETSVCIPLTDSQKYSAVQRILSSPAKKVFHFGMFDVAMLHSKGMEVENFWWDTLVAQHVLEPELPRSLEFLVSIYTREPYYKQEGRANIPDDTKVWGENIDKKSLYVYNCKDSAVTIEVQLEQEKELEIQPRLKRLFQFEMDEGPAARRIADAGIPLDLERRELMRKALLHRWAKLQFILDGLAGKPVNVRSPKIKDLLYKEMGLPARRKRNGNLSTDEDAIVASIGYCKQYIQNLKTPKAKQDWQVKLEICKLILEIRGIRQFLATYILAKISSDGRIRTTYKTSNTETGRWAGQKYIDGTGINGQTFPRGEVLVPEDVDSIIDIDKMLQELEKEECQTTETEEQELSSA